MIIKSEVRWADNTTDLKRNLLDGLDTVDAMRKSAERLTASMGGEGLFRAANNLVAAVSQLGDTDKLTTAEQERANAMLDKAIEKYTAMGRTAPSAMLQLRDALKQSDNAWQGFVDHFDIKSAISDPLGTAKGAMTAFAETLGPAGVEAAAITGGAVALGAALFTLTEKAAAVGGKLNDMGEKTGQSVPWLSQLSNAAVVAGSDLDSLGAATFMFEKNLGEGTEKFQSGLARIGLSIQEVKAAGPDEWLKMIAAGLKGVSDPSDRAAAAMELFGRQGREIIPTLMKLNDALASTKDITPWSEEQARAAESLDMQIASLEVHAKALGIAFGSALIPAASAVTGILASLVDTFVAAPIQGYTGAFHLLTDAIGGAALAEQSIGAVLDTSNHLFAESARAGVDAASAQERVALSLIAQGIALDKVAIVTGLNIIDVKVLAAAQKDADDATKSYADSLDRVNMIYGAGKPLIASDYPQAFQTWVVNLVQAAKASDDVARSMKAVAEVTGLTIQQMNMLASAEDKADQVAAKNVETLKRTQEQIDKLAAARAAEWSKITTDVSQAMGGMQGALDSISGAIVPFAEHLLASGMSAKEVGVYLGLTDVQLKALEWDMKNNAKAADDNAAALHRMAEGAEHGRAAQDALGAAMVDSFNKTNSSVMGISTTFSGWNDTIMGTTDSIGGMSMAMAALTGDINDNSKSVLTLAGAWITAADAKKAFDMGNSLDVDHAARDPEINQLLKDGWSLENAESIKMGHQWGYTPQLYDEHGNPESTPSKGERVPGYKGGVTDFAGGLAMVHRDELLVNMPAGTDVIPAGKWGGGGGASVTVNVAGVWDARSKRELGAVMEDAFMKIVKQNRLLPQ